ncbi:S8 family serine peptidase [Bacillus sp. NTK034]|uniref:S8 family serine peptidase n=1 Tax=Bacillus sp. NTK034 TaxID=2802176 RepID=UPI001A8C83A6|nr:S8 family serine peptidase [Bacillus sp. NTK034]MBN8204186.1 S8 family serine peptidase [Bacillus sp. NTK034]
MKNRLMLITIVLFAAIALGGMIQGSGATSGKAATVTLDPLLEQVMETAAEPVEVIVSFRGVKNIGANQQSLLTGLGIEKGILFQSLPIAGVVATKDQIEKLAQSEQVLSIYLNKELRYENDSSTDLTGVDAVRTSEEMRKLNGGLPVSGKGIGVVINDSGVDGTHKDIAYGDHLVQNVLGSTNLHAIDSLLPMTYIENVPNSDSNSGHGTHVAGIVGGNGAMSGGKYEGVAPGASLIGYGSGAALAMLDTIGGFDYALTHQHDYNIRVITNSWGDTSEAGLPFDPLHPINIATKKLYDRGIITVFSAGNSGPGEKTISGNYKKAPWVITVAAGDKEGKLADFSSRGERDKRGTFIIDGEQWAWEDRPTVTSPGVDIISTRVISPVASLGATKDVQYIDPAYLPYYTTMSGTSMAAPHVAGVVALVLDANPLLSPKEVKEIVQSTATAMPGYEPWEAGAGYVNAYSAVEKAFKVAKGGQK